MLNQLIETSYSEIETVTQELKTLINNTSVDQCYIKNSNILIKSSRNRSPTAMIMLILGITFFVGGFFLHWSLIVVGVLFAIIAIRVLSVSPNTNNRKSDNSNPVCLDKDCLISIITNTIEHTQNMWKERMSPVKQKLDQHIKSMDVDNDRKYQLLGPITTITSVDINTLGYISQIYSSVTDTNAQDFFTDFKNDLIIALETASNTMCTRIKQLEDYK